MKTRSHTEAMSPSCRLRRGSETVGRVNSAQMLTPSTLRRARLGTLARNLDCLGCAPAIAPPPRAQNAMRAHEASTWALDLAARCPQTYWHQVTHLGPHPTSDEATATGSRIPERRWARDSPGGVWRPPHFRRPSEDPEAKAPKAQGPGQSRPRHSAAEAPNHAAPRGSRRRTNDTESVELERHMFGVPPWAPLGPRALGARPRDQQESVGIRVGGWRTGIQGNA